jgi:hypothetical protein
MKHTIIKGQGKMSMIKIEKGKYHEFGIDNEFLFTTQIHKENMGIIR